MGWEVHGTESSELASGLVLKACGENGVDPEGLVVHSDNGGPMKGATLQCKAIVVTMAVLIPPNALLKFLVRCAKGGNCGVLVLT